MNLLAFVAVLCWNPSLSATGYTLFYGTASGGCSQSITVSGTCVRVEVPDGPDYFFAVEASGTGGTSGPSNELHVSGQFIERVPGGLVLFASDGDAVLEVSNDLVNWAEASTFTGMTGPVFYPLTEAGEKLFFKLEGTQ
jgi:hypothetical protein